MRFAAPVTKYTALAKLHERIPDIQSAKILKRKGRDWIVEYKDSRGFHHRVLVGGTEDSRGSVSIWIQKMKLPSPEQLALRFAKKPDLSKYKKEWEKDQKRKQKLIRDAWSAFRKLRETFIDRIKMEGLSASGMGVKGVGNWLRRQSDWASFLDTYVGPESVERRMPSWRKNQTTIMRKILRDEILVREAKELFEKEMSKTSVPFLLWQDRKPMRESIPPALLDLLPSNLVVEVDPSGTIKKVTSRFGNKAWNWHYKTEQLRNLIRQYNEIARKVKRDLKSSQPDVRVSALITSIIMETGIRPGAIGNGKLDEKTGQLIETFGAVTLRPEHVRFIRDDFVELEFKGKKQFSDRTNLASLSDREIIIILKEMVEKSRKGGWSQIFYKSNGTPYDYGDLKTYMKEKFSDFNVTDFRKLRATESLLRDLQEKQAQLREEVIAFADSSEEDLRERAAERLADFVREAQERAREALSHDVGTAQSTTQGAYIDPGVLLRIFSTGRISDQIRGAILQGGERLTFDPRALISDVKIATAAKRWTGMRRVSSKEPETIQDILDLLEESNDHL